MIRLWEQTGCHISVAPHSWSWSRCPVWLWPSHHELWPSCSAILMSCAPPTQGWGTLRCLGQEATHAEVLVWKLEKPYLFWSKKIEICHLQHLLAAVLIDSTSHWHQLLRRWNKLLRQIILAFSILFFLCNMMMKVFNNCHDNSPIRIDFILVLWRGPGGRPPHPWGDLSEESYKAHIAWGIEEA